MSAGPRDLGATTVPKVLSGLRSRITLERDYSVERPTSTRSMKYLQFLTFTDIVTENARVT